MKQFPLLPHYFKWIAVGLVVFSVVSSFALKDYLWDYSVQANTFFLSLINFTLFIYFFTRREMDDEMFIQMRFKVMTGGVLAMIVMLFSSSILDIVDSEGISNKGAAGTLL